MRNLVAALTVLASPLMASEITIEIAGEANGVVTIDLLDDVAPQHVERIKTLATEGAYDNIVFHQMICL